MILILIIVLLFCYVGNYFNYVEKFSQSQYGYVACPPQFTKVQNSDNMYYNSGNVGINNDNPTANLHVTGYSLTSGILGVSGGTLYAKDNNYLQEGSLVIGSTTKNYGGSSSGWSDNTAGLMLECDQNTEIAVHDSGNRVASLMYYEGPSNTIHIGRNMHWGVTNTRCWGNLSVNSSTTLGGGLVVNGLTKVTGELQIAGAHRTSHICHSSGNTYIRGGNNGGQVLLNDYGGGRVYCGSDLFVNGTISGVCKTGQKWALWIGQGAASGWHFSPYVHNQKCVRIKFYFNGQYYCMKGVDTPASGPVTLTWENNKPINGYYLPYPYTNQGANQGPKFWFMRMDNLAKSLMRIVVLYYDYTDPESWEDLIYGFAR
jgi:hypothetical protein